MTLTITPEMLADLRKKVRDAGAHEWCLEKDEVEGGGVPRYVMQGGCVVADVYSAPIEYAEHIAAANPAVVLALLDRLDALEKAAEPPCGCGRPATVRGDPECDGCGKDCYFCECEPLEPANK